jgi:anhydro-N-acetylmuramic acid kinase
MRAVGLMSGTSLDGIDAAFISTDGERIDETGLARTTPYDPILRMRLRAALGRPDAPPELERDLTEAHARAVQGLLAAAQLAPADVDVVGFHGHTIWHRPREGVTCQIGDGALLAELLGIDVVNDFRSADVAAGGEGAPLVPLYHAALARGLDKPLAVVNLGGVANVTWIGTDGRLIAFDTGPGNALLDDWCAEKTGAPFDEGGKLAAAGTPRSDVVERMLENPYFDRAPPKSLDRLDFDLGEVSHLSAADGAATLTEFTARCVARGAALFPAPARRFLATGGGRHNRSLMEALRRALAAQVEPVESVGWDGDALEAQAFGFLAVRSLRGLPLSVPGTTGCAAPTRGGALHRGRK